MVVSIPHLYKDDFTELLKKAYSTRGVRYIEALEVPMQGGRLYELSGNPKSLGHLCHAWGLASLPMDFHNN